MNLPLPADIVRKNASTFDTPTCIGLSATLVGGPGTIILVAANTEALQNAWKNQTSLPLAPEGIQEVAIYASHNIQDSASFTTAALHYVLAERHRQIEEEGWTPAHDDEHYRGDLAAAAASYALAATNELNQQHQGNHLETPPPMWPWDAEWWKPATPRRMLVKAGALLLAAIERIDREAKKN